MAMQFSLNSSNCDTSVCIVNTRKINLNFRVQCQSSLKLSIAVVPCITLQHTICKHSSSVTRYARQLNHGLSAVETYEVLIGAVTDD